MVMLSNKEIGLLPPLIKSRSKKDKTPSEKTLSTPPFNQETDGVTLPSNGVTADKVTQSSQTKRNKRR